MLGRMTLCLAGRHSALQKIYDLIILVQHIGNLNNEIFKGK